MADYPIASDLSYQVLQMRQRKGELGAPKLNPADRRRQLVVERRVVREPQKPVSKKGVSHGR